MTVVQAPAVAAAPTQTPPGQPDLHVARWQQFLVAQRELGEMQVTGISDAVTETATRNFQRRHRLPESGLLDTATRTTATRLGYDPKIFCIGPDRSPRPGSGDVRVQRPYFLVPIDQPDVFLADVQERIIDWVTRMKDRKRSALLRIGDLLNPAALSAELRDPANRVGQYLFSRLTCDTQRLLQQRGDGELSPYELRVLVNDLNGILLGECIWTEQRFSEAPLDQELLRDVHVELDPGDERVPIRNRRLLEAAVSTKLLAPMETLGPVTDVYILSHGWHRNFYGAISAYDRLSGRLAILMHRRRLTSPKPYHPLFLTFHWHSDPGQDGWVDKAGRRHKASFLEQVERVFERPSPAAERHVAPDRRFTDLFEELFQLFSRMSAPDTRPLEGEEFEREAGDLALRLRKVSLRDAPVAPLQDKIAVAWTCYHQAEAKGGRQDQDQNPAWYLTPQQALKGLLGFVAGIVGVMALAGFLFRSVGQVPGVPQLVQQWNRLHHTLTPEWFTGLLAWMGDLVPGHPISATVPFLILTEALFTLAQFLDAGIGGVAAFFLASLPPGILSLLLLKYLTTPKEKKPSRGIPPWRLVFWILALVPCSVPLLLYLFVTYLGGTMFAWLVDLSPALLFDERLGRRNRDITQAEVAHGPSRTKARDPAMISGRQLRYHLAWLARLPIRLLRNGLAAGNTGSALVDGVDNQLAFWEMQLRGSVVGRNAARFLDSLFAHPKFQKSLWDGGPRLHLAGHSFGSLVLINTLRHLYLDQTFRNAKESEDGKAGSKGEGNGADASQPSQPNNASRIVPQGVFLLGSKDEPGKFQVDTLTLLQGAVASSWFAQETRLVKAVRRCIACIYSAYDTANGFYYPGANNSRLAAGYVGLTLSSRKKKAAEEQISVGKLPKPENPGLFASLTRPPDLKAELGVKSIPEVLNLDASRMIYEGPVALGGGHGDIFKDDVVHLLWSVTSLDEPPPPETPE